MYRKEDKSIFDLSGINQQCYSKFDIFEGFMYKVSFSEDVSMYIPIEYSNYLEIRELSTPVYEKLTIMRDKNYELINKGDIGVGTFIEGYSDISEAKMLDVIYYDGYGNVSSVSHNSYYGIRNELHGNYKMKLSLLSHDEFVIGIPYEYKDLIEIKQISEAIVYNVDMLQGQYYEVINSSGKNLVVGNNSDELDKSFEIIYYGGNGNIKQAYFNQKDDINIYDGEKIRIGLSHGKSMNLSIPYEYKDSIKKVSMPVFQKLDIEFGKTYELISNNPTFVYHDKYNGSFDILKYDKSGDLNSIIENSYEHIQTYGTGKVRISMNEEGSSTLYIPYESNSEVKISNLPLLKEIVIDDTSNYELISKMDNKYTLGLYLNEENYDLDYDVIEYDDNDNVVNILKGQSNYGRLEIGNSGKIKIDISNGKKLKIVVPYDFKYELKKINIPLFKMVEIKDNKTYELSNSPLIVEKMIMILFMNY